MRKTEHRASNHAMFTLLIFYSSGAEYEAESYFVRGVLQYKIVMRLPWEPTYALSSFYSLVSVQIGITEFVLLVDFCGLH